MINRFIMAAFLVSTSTVSAKSITFKVYYEDREQPPYYLGNSDLIPKNPGVAVEMVKLLEKHVDQIRVKLVRAPWNRCKKSLEAGLADGIFNASFKKKRLKIGSYPWKGNQVDDSRRITELSYSLYLPKNSPLKWDGMRLSGLKGSIAAPAGYSIVDDLEKKHGIKVLQAPGTANLMLMLKNKRVMAIAAQTVTGDSFLRPGGDFNEFIVKHPIPLVSKNYFLMISKPFQKKHPKLTESIWNAIREIRESQFSKLMAKYSVD